jgi:hypothetical protein
LALSLLVHGMFLGIFVWLLPGGDGLPGPGKGTFDTGVEAPGMEVNLLLYDSPSSRPRGDKSPVPVNWAEAPIAAAEKPNAPTSIAAPAISQAAGGQPGARVQALGRGSDNGSGPAGRGQGRTTSFFQIHTNAMTIVYVIDRSMSMGLHGLLEAAKKELLLSLEQLPESARFQVVVYNRQAWPLPIHGQTALAAATPANKREVARFLGTLFAEGSTDHVHAIREALRLQPDVIFVLTDADELKPEQVRQLTALNHGQTTIHTVQLVTRPGRNQRSTLDTLAGLNQGLFRSVSLQPPAVVERGVPTRAQSDD